MRYGSVCSGIEAATVAWHPLGWHPAFFAEIEPFCCAVLRHHYPSVPNCGDFTTIQEAPSGAIDLLIGGTPCQSFSVAGRRAGLADPRGNLTLAYLALIDRLRPRWVVWENVPGILSDDNGRTFGTVLGLLGDCGYGFAYRVLDAQYFGIPQRRRRVFVVGYRGDWRPPAAVLFERESLSGHPAPSRETGESVAACLAASAGHHGRSSPRGDGSDPLHVVAPPSWLDIHPTLAASTGGPASPDWLAHAAVPYGFNWQAGNEDVALSAERRTTLRTAQHPAIAYSTSGHGFWREGVGALPQRLDKDGENGLVIPLQYVDQWSRHQRQNGVGNADADSPMYTLECTRQHGIAGWNGDATPKGSMDVIPTLRAQQGGEGIGNADAFHVRRLTPRECERLQGFPDDYTLIPYRGKPAADGPRYRALGNSFAVPVVHWIGARIQLVEEVLRHALPTP